MKPTSTLTPLRGRRTRFALLAFVCVLAGSATAFADLYVAPTAQGTGDGSSVANAAYYRNYAGFWNTTVQAAIDSGPTTVWFARTTYAGPGDLRIWDIGHPSNLLTLAVTAAAGTFVMKNDGDSYIFSIRGCQNVKMKDFVFTGTASNSAGYVENSLTSPKSPSRWITFENCTFHDLPSAYYSALSISRFSREVTINNCHFYDVGFDLHAHMIYNAYGTTNVTVSNSTFSNCKGQYIRFRDDADFGKVDNCTFHSTGDLYNKEFIHVWVQNDNIPAGRVEFLGRNYQFTNNSFLWDTSDNIDQRWGVRFAADGYNVPAPLDYWLNTTEANTLNTGTVAQKQAILSPDMGLSNGYIKIYGNTFGGAHGQVAYSHVANYGSGDGGFSGACNIANWPATSGTLAATPAFRNAGMEAYTGDPRRCWTTHSAFDLANGIDTRPVSHVGLDGSALALRMRRTQATEFGQAIGNLSTNYEIRFLLAMGNVTSGSPGAVRLVAKVYHNEIKNACLALAINNTGQVGYLNSSGTFVAVPALGTMSLSTESPAGSGQFPNSNWYQFRIRTFYSGGTLNWDIARGTLKTAGSYTSVSGPITQWLGSAPTAGARPGSITFQNYGNDVILDSFFGVALP